MAALFGDSFDHYATADYLEKWSSLYAGTTAPTISAGNGRRGTQSLRQSIAADNTRPIAIVPGTNGPTPSGATAVWGHAFQANRFDTLEIGTNFDPTSATAQSFYWILRQGSSNQIIFSPTATGTIRAYRGTTLLGTTSAALSGGANTYIEYKVLLSDTVGTIEIRFNGIPVLVLSGIDTLNTASATWDELVYGKIKLATGATTTWDIDDLYVLDGTTSTDDPRNDFLGDCRVDASYANAVGTYNDSTPSGGAVDRYTMIDEALVDDDTTYNTFATAGNKDSYNYQAAPVSGATIHFLQANGWLRKEDAGAATARLFTRISGADYYGSSHGPGTTYLDKRQLWAQKPSDSADWSTGDYDAAEFGCEKET